MMREKNEEIPEALKAVLGGGGGSLVTPSFSSNETPLNTGNVSSTPSGVPEAAKDVPSKTTESVPSKVAAASVPPTESVPPKAAESVPPKKLSVSEDDGW